MKKLLIAVLITFALQTYGSGPTATKTSESLSVISYAKTILKFSTLPQEEKAKYMNLIDSFQFSENYQIKFIHEAPQFAASFDCDKYVNTGGGIVMINVNKNQVDFYTGLDILHELTHAIRASEQKTCHQVGSDEYLREELYVMRMEYQFALDFHPAEIMDVRYDFFTNKAIKNGKEVQISNPKYLDLIIFISNPYNYIERLYAQKSNN